MPPSLECAVAKVIAAQTPGALLQSSLLTESAFNADKVMFTLTGLPLCGVDAAVRGPVPEIRVRDGHIHRDLMAEAKVLINVGGSYLAGGNGFDGGGRAGDAVAAGKDALASLLSLRASMVPRWMGMPACSKALVSMP